MGILGPRAKGQRGIWSFDDRWQPHGGQAKRGHGNRNDGKEGPGRFLCMSGSETSACLSFLLAVSAGGKGSRVIKSVTSGGR